MPRSYRNTIERFWAKVDVRGPDECWPWRGSLAKGYGRFMLRGVRRHAHVWMHILQIGPIPEGFEVDHLCHTTECKLTDTCPHRMCVNPAHLEAKTHRDNDLRGNGIHAQNARKDRCPKCGGEYHVEGGRARRCRPCRNARARARWASLVTRRKGASNHGADIAG